MSYRRLFIFALLTSPTMLWAQFTTFIPPQNKAADSAKSAVVVQQRVQADSIMKVKLTDMKAWVDSAAGVAPAPTAASDSLSVSLPAARDSQTTTPAVAKVPSPTVRNGARAPATASDLPLLALIGAIALAIGTVLLAGTQLGRDRA